MTAFFFGESQIAKVRELVPEAFVADPGSSAADYIAKHLIRCVSADDFKVEDGVLILSAGVKEKISRNLYGEKERMRAAEAIKGEIRSFLGLEADVDFLLSRTEEWEIDEDRLPYCDFTTETMYFYSITIKIKLER